MSKAATETLSVIVEREIPFPPEKIWRALTQPHLIEEWLMKNDFKPAVDHRFTLRGDDPPHASGYPVNRGPSARLERLDLAFIYPHVQGHWGATLTACG
jgi:uncharacterized protein YndB with AHSA1/START domain